MKAPLAFNILSIVHFAMITIRSLDSFSDSWTDADVRDFLVSKVD
jgi:hypothetical protein